jgi:hypothetical protein
MPIMFIGFARLPVPELQPDSGWQTRFLASPLLRALRPLHWQQLLQGLQSEWLSAHTTLIEAGTVGTECFVLQSGRARVHLGHRELAELCPGELFGEEALISGCVRSASVTLIEAGRVGRLSAARFERWLLDAAITPLASMGARRVIRIVPDTDAQVAQWALTCGLETGRDQASDSAALCVPVSALRHPALPLRREAAYGVVGGMQRERWLAAFILASRGFDARPLADPDQMA